jgi:hypothetical protein
MSIHSTSVQKLVSVQLPSGFAGHSTSGRGSSSIAFALRHTASLRETFAGALSTARRVGSDTPQPFIPIATPAFCHQSCPNSFCMQKLYFMYLEFMISAFVAAAAHVDATATKVASAAKVSDRVVTGCGIEVPFKFPID